MERPEPRRRVRIFSRIDQNRASKKVLDTTLSAIEPTYGALVVDVDQHFAVVRITISPFRRPEHPGHVFFASSTRYTQCCTIVPPKTVEDKVKEKVDAILKAHYPQVSCDLTSAYAFSAEEIKQLTLSVTCRVRADTILKGLAQHNDQNPSEETCEQQVESIVTLVRKAIKLRLSNDARRQDSDSRARKSRLRSSHPLPPVSWVPQPLPQIDKNQVASYGQFVELIYQRCLEIEGTSNELATQASTLKFIAGCILEVSPYLPPIRTTSNNSPETRNRSAYWEWRGRALMTNAIVNGLLPSWGRWAHLLYDKLAATSNWFRPLRKLAHPRLRDLASKISTRLKVDPGPKAFEGLGSFKLFDPEKEMASVLDIPGEWTNNLLLPARISIPSLFYAMGGRVPKVMLDRATSPQKRWCEDGKMREVTLHNAGLQQDLVDLLSDESRLRQKIETLTSLSMISEESSTDGIRYYICRCESARDSFDRNKAQHIHQAFGLCCYVFPRTHAGDSSFRPVGRHLMSVVQHLLRLHAEMALEIPPSNDSIETLIAASQFGKLSTRQDLLEMAAKLQKDPPPTHLKAEIVHQQSVLLRLNGKTSDSIRVIQDFLNGPYLVSNTRHGFLVGLLYISQANNQAYHFDFSQAQRESQKWQLSVDNSCLREVDVLWDQIYCNGRILRGEGRFEEARRCFEGCLATVQLPESKRILIKSNLADIYCELDYLQLRRVCLNKPEGYSIPNIAYLDKAKSIIEPEIGHMRACGLQSKAFRRLLLSSIEIDIKQDGRAKAEALITELLAIYKGLTEPDIIDRLGHVRALIAWARVSPLSEAEERWSAALRQNKFYNPGEEDVFTCGVIYLFISFVRLNLQQTDGGKAAFCRALDITGKQRPQFLMPGIGTYLFNYVREGLQSGWQLIVTPTAVCRE